tara:strand:- start:19386 stop:20390 length:1005 start_codon:yes stop_codon:yes gene_type:complete
MKKTVAIVLNWNNAEDTILCLSSLLNLKKNGKQIEIVIVDNCSDDDSRDQIIKNILSLNYVSGESKVNKNQIDNIEELLFFSTDIQDLPNIYFAKSISNLGYSGGNNNGIRLGQILEADYFWILNNDVVVDKEAFLFLAQRMEIDRKIGICGAHIMMFNEKEITQCLGGSYFTSFSGKGFPILEDHFDKTPTNRMVESKISYISGASMFIRKDFISRVGLLDERFFLFCEEIDWAIRSNEIFNLGVELKSIIYHKEGATIGTGSASNSKGGSKKSEFYLARSKLILTWKHRKHFFISVFIFQIIRALRLGFLGRYDLCISILKACSPFHGKFYE